MFGFGLVHQFQLHPHGHGGKRVEVITDRRTETDGLILIIGKTVVRTVQRLEVEAELARKVQPLHSGLSGRGENEGRSKGKSCCDGTAPQSGEKGKIVHEGLPYDGRCGL